MKNDLFKALAEELAPYLMPYFENKVKDVLSSLPDYKKDIPEFFTKKQVMSKYQISAMTLWRMEQKGELIPYRVGNKVMYRPKDVEKLFK